VADVSLMAVPSQPQDGTRCANCGAEVVADQRYCLSCGHPVSPVRLGFLDVLQDQGTHPAPQWAAPGTLEVTPVGYATEPQGGLGGWVRRNGAIFGLLSVLLLCLIAGLLLGHWASAPGKSGPSVVKVEGLSLGAAAPLTSSAPSSASPTKTTAAAAAAKAKKEQQEAAKEAAKETKAEKAPPPAPKKVTHQELQKLSTSTGKKHAEEINAKGAEPIETGG
jgi:zinc-ribbon domain